MPAAENPVVLKATTGPTRLPVTVAFATSLFVENAVVVIPEPPSAIPKLSLPVALGSW